MDEEWTGERSLDDAPVTGGTATYNDTPGRRQEEVVAKLREAGDRARKEGK